MIGNFSSNFSLFLLNSVSKSSLVESTVLKKSPTKFLPSVSAFFPLSTRASNFPFTFSFVSAANPNPA